MIPFLPMAGESALLKVVLTHIAMKELYDAWRSVDRNKIAMLLSVFPGLGHLYKHDYMSGFCIMTVGNAVMIFTAAWLSLATIGMSLILVPAAWVVGVAYSAYYTDDKHGTHPWMHVWEKKWWHFRHGNKKAVPVSLK